MCVCVGVWAVEPTSKAARTTDDEACIVLRRNTTDGFVYVIITIVANLRARCLLCVLTEDRPVFFISEQLMQLAARAVISTDKRNSFFSMELKKTLRTSAANRKQSRAVHCFYAANDSGFKFGPAY